MKPEVDVLSSIVSTLWLCECRHLGTDRILELAGGHVLNDEVEHFELIGHPSASEAYAWCSSGRGRRRCHSVLKASPVWDAASAVAAVHGSEKLSPELAAIIRSMDVHDSRSANASCVNPPRHRA